MKKDMKNNGNGAANVSEGNDMSVFRFFKNLRSVSFPKPYDVLKSMAMSILLSTIFQGCIDKKPML
jgi:hypothetical protein